MTLEELPFLRKIRSWRHKMFHIFYFLQCDMVLGNVNPASWIFYAISNEKSCLTSMPFLSTYIDLRTVNFFSPAESWLVNLNFPRASRMQGAGCQPRNLHGYWVTVLVTWLLFHNNLTPSHPLMLTILTTLNKERGLA